MNSYEGHIDSRQGVYLTAGALLAMVFLQYPEFLVDAGGPAAWQVAITLTIGSVILFLPMVALFRRFPGTGLAEISEEVAGPVFGPLITLIVALWLMFSATLTVRNFTETFIATILPFTPPSVLIICVLACVAYASYRGLESICRSAEIFFPLTMVLGLLTLGFSLLRADGAFIYPLWGHGLPDTLRAGTYYIGMTGEVVVLLVVGYAFRTTADFRRSGMYGIIIFGVVTALSVAVLIMVFGSQDAAQSPFPMYQLARLVYLGRFFQRMESAVVLFWFFAAALRLAILFHAAVVALGGALRLPYYRPLIYPVAVMIAAGSLLPKDFVTVLRLERDWDRLIALSIYGVPILLLILALIRKKGGQTHAS